MTKVKYKHIAVYPDTFSRFKKVKVQVEQARKPRAVTDDDVLNELLDDWETREAGEQP